MERTYLLKNALMVNEGQIQKTDVLIRNERIERIGELSQFEGAELIDASGKHLLPGIIDGQVHFRDPGLTHKADLYTESKAALAGGVTSFIDMPNTVPNVLSLEAFREKEALAARKSLANYGFFMGVNGENVEEVIKMDTSRFLAVSDDGLYFSGKGNLLADHPEILERLFAHCQTIVAIHAEKEQIVEANEQLYREKYGEEVPVRFHPLIRSSEACFTASKEAIALAKKHGARFHVLHLTTEAETHLFGNDLPLKEKKITTEVSVHHLWFCDEDYERLGVLIKWNPAIKSRKDRDGLMEALLDDRIDIITTDHAPHTLEEKKQSYFKSMSGAPMVQHSLNCMLEFYRQGRISLEKIVEKMCHNPAILYRIKERGFIREGYRADLVLVDLEADWTVAKENILYKCGWSPLEGTRFHSRVTHTFVNGHLVYHEGSFDERVKGQRLSMTGEA